MNLSDRGGQIEGKVMRRLSVFWGQGHLMHGLGNSLVSGELICNE